MVERQELKKGVGELFPIGTWEFDYATRNVFWSDEALKIYDLDCGENCQPIYSWLSVIHPDDLDMVYKIIANSRKNLVGNSFIHRIIRKDGSVRWIQSISKYNINVAGHPTGLHGFVHDVTEQKESEDKIRFHLKVLGEISSLQSHQVRSPVASLLGLINLFNFDDLCDPENGEILTRVKAVAEMLDHTIKNIICITNQIEIMNLE